MRSFPEHWETVSLKEVVSYRKGKKPKNLSNTKIAGTVPYIDIKAFSTGEIRQYADIKSSNLTTKENVLVVWDGARSGLVGNGQEGAIGSTIMALRPIEINSLYLFRFLQTKYETINSNPRGTGIPHVDPELFWNINFPIAPLNEQHRIVAKLEQLLAKVEVSRERLNKIPTLLKRFRQSVLASAYSGRLTADWRVAHVGDQPDKKAEVVANGLPDLPETWYWSRLPETGKMSRGKSRHRPRNAPFLFGGSYPFLQTGDIAQSGGRITSHKQTYSEAGIAQSRLWPAKTVCITIAANIAESALLTYPACFPDSVVGIIADESKCLPEYLEFFIRTAKSDLSTFAPATAQKNINIKILSDVLVPLPPELEQKEIVRRVETLFKIADQIEERYQKAKAHIDKLTQSILAKAFRGELVPQDQNDEPANELLRKITGSRETFFSHGKSIRKKKRS